ncbi:anti-phage dCTP deaminase [Caldimonas sp. KR1-144]|uniref:anti-phage dCTP deaminase n=1 Tax=Caldimonas sp. KR1-144 TaxID=3400911 RepID=UPI003C00B0ED
MATNLAVVSGPSPSGGTFSAHQRITGLQKDEIVIALCGPLGTPLHEVAEAFKEQLESKDFGYTHVEVIRLSRVIRTQAKLSDGATIKQLIDAGNDLRDSHGAGFLAQHAIKHIFTQRQKHFPADAADGQGGLFETGSTAPAVVPTKSGRVCHIIDSIKNSQELRLLRQVYGDMLHVVGVYTPIEQRIDRLSRNPNSKDDIHALIDRDSGEEMAHGQRVQETFPQADFFLRADAGTSSQLEARVKRFLALMLGTSIITPTQSERAMYEAFSAARNSACLSRQVGAAIADKDGHVLATGWNDVPRAFGGLYETIDMRTSPDVDHRCWNKDGGKCFNDEEKTFLAQQVIGKLAEAKVIQPQDVGRATELIRHDSQLRSLIEFSRAVHAEMHALLNASTSYGGRIREGKLFVTTYPCHSCARHIVAAGIAEVYFLEPYRKSLATKLHGDAITESETDTKKVRIMPFDGVAPSRFLKFFGYPESGRKDQASGRMITGSPQPVMSITMEAVTTLEGLVIKELESSDGH